MTAVIRSIALLLAALAAGCASGDEREGRTGLEGVPAETHTVKRALSGDTIELDNGETIRYAGIEAPKAGEPFAEESRLRNDECVVGRDVVVEVRFLPGLRDASGRRFANVTVPARTLQVSLWVGPEILEAGLARIDYRSMPAGVERFFEVREENARQARRGIWSRPR
jgi:endonuclease YncB( thermonuclease family)